MIENTCTKLSMQNQTSLLMLNLRPIIENFVENIIKLYVYFIS